MRFRILLATIAIGAMITLNGCRSTSRRYCTTPVVTSPGCCNGQAAVQGPSASVALPPPPQ